MVKKNTLALCAAAAIGFAGAAMLGMGNDSNIARAQDAGKTTGGAMSVPAGNGAALTTKDISLDQAGQVVLAAMQKARDTNTKMDIAVVDAGGNLKAFARMDGAWIGSIDIAIRKAKTARFFDMPTGEIGKLSQPGGPLYNIEVSNGGLISFPGGIPLKAADGTVIGAIGVSGSTVENDHTVAEAGAAVIK
ncbi:MAG TPA: heme-binding protein [Tepidisphaeraceae bacterium]|jgi:uncharacterized protein GlcG (DUF336 family)